MNMYKPYIFVQRTTLFFSIEIIIYQTKARKEKYRFYTKLRSILTSCHKRCNTYLQLSHSQTKMLYCKVCNIVPLSGGTWIMIWHT
ncbi:hypothetical protein XELAEV_18003058mg [Xenopus laevis]|uniref:Uncharacterized protein n=1 Tax=Xenopus laevis TaxID=8355 RepID=A0A974BNQ9_XENLA|nr:hypothetical protein XELAEV_18003058mg [Xenopus laevis]